MTFPLRYLTALLTLASIAAADIEVRPLAFDHDGQSFAPVLVHPTRADGLPGLLMVPNWLGVTPQTIEKASRIAAMGYVVYVADVYGADTRPADGRAARELVGRFRGDRDLMRARVGAAHEHFLSLAGTTGVPAGHYAAIGFCFGGGAILEYARTGADLAAYISFHGDLLSPTLDADSAAITGRVLVLHGDADPVVPPDHVNQWMAAMRATEVDWQFVSYGGAVHSFTNPHANTPGSSQYHPEVAARAFAAMRTLLDEVFDARK